jgi:hypothetical protein
MELMVVLATVAAGLWLACAIAVTILMVRTMRQPYLDAAPAPPPTLPSVPHDETPHPEQEICDAVLDRKAGLDVSHA